MQIQCSCGAFKANLANFPGSTPGRLACYCDDCQKYLMHLGRTDLLNAAGGTEIVPAYPADMTITAGQDRLKCTRLTQTGMYRWSTTCCNTPIANTRPGTAWLGILSCMFATPDPHYLVRTFGPVRSAIMGKFAKGEAPKGTPPRFDLKAMVAVTPYMFKGFVCGKSKPSPFFADDGKTPIVAAQVLTQAEQQQLQSKWDAIKSYR